MNKSMNLRTIILLIALCLVVVAFLYMRFIQQPIQLGIDAADSARLNDQTTMDGLMIKLAKQKQMLSELDELRA